MAPPLLVQAVRLPFLTGSLLPILVVAVWRGAEAPGFGAALAACLAGVSFLHLGSNLINDYFDAKGSDPRNQLATPFSGGSRVIQEGRLTSRAVLLLALAFYLAAVACGVLLAMWGRPWVLAMGAVGLLGGFLYSASPVAFMSRGLGEAVIFLIFGPVLTLSAGYALYGQFLAVAFCLGLPQAWQITAVLWINQFPDLAADAAAGKRNLVVRLGISPSRHVFLLLMLAPWPTLAWLVHGLGLSPWLYLALAAALPAAKAVLITYRRHDDPRALVPAQALTILTHLATGALMLLGLALARWLGA